MCSSTSQRDVTLGGAQPRAQEGQDLNWRPRLRSEKEVGAHGASKVGGSQVSFLSWGPWGPRSGEA